MKKLSKHLRMAKRTTRRLGALALITAALLAGGSALAQNQDSTANTGETLRATIAIAKTMDPNTWMQMMTMSMDPRIWMNPISSCAACHDNEDVGRYQQVFGPFVPATMMNPAMWASPDAYNNMMASVTDAKAAEHWQRAVEEKYGLKPGDTAPTMHNWWPWGMAPTVPVPTPAQ